MRKVTHFFFLREEIKKTASGCFYWFIIHEKWKVLSVITINISKLKVDKLFRNSIIFIKDLLRLTSWNNNTNIIS